MIPSSAAIHPLMIVYKITQSPPEIFAGDTFLETFNLANVGDEEAKLVQLLLDIENPFALVNSTSNIFIGNIGANENRSVSLEIFVDGNAAGVYSIPFTIKYMDSSGESYVQSGAFDVEIEVEVKGRPIVYETVTSQNETGIFPGDTLVETFKLTNVGSADSKKTQLSLDVTYPFALTNSSSNFYVGDLRTGESRLISVEFSTDENALVGVYSISYTIGYENSSGQGYAKSGVFSVKINGEPQLLIGEITFDPPNLAPGQSGVMTVALTNAGTDSAYDVAVRIFGGQDIVASSFEYISSIDREKSKSILFPVSVSSMLEPETYVLLNITVSYRDYFNNTAQLSKLYEYRIMATTSIIPNFYIGLAVGIALLTLFGYFMYTWKPKEPYTESKAGEPARTDTNETDQPTHLKKFNNSKVEHTGKKTLNKKRVVLLCCIIALYALILIPYVTHTNLSNAGIVTYSGEINLESLPQDIQEICRLRGLTTPFLLLVEHGQPNWVTMVITPDKIPLGTPVEMLHYIVNWHVDWRDFNLIGTPFQTFAIANVKELDSLESAIERIFSTQEGTIVYYLSKADFYAGPILLVLLLTLILQGRLALWNIPAALGCYSLQIWFLNNLAYKHYLAVGSEWEYFGYSFAVLLPLAFYLWHFERSSGGRSIANKMRALSRILGLLREDH